MSHLDRPFRAVQRRPVATLLLLVAIAVSAYVIVFPFTVTRFVPMTDLPFHAANSGVLRHYFDPAYHLREQFELKPIAVPYMSTYVIGAIAMFFAPSWVAVKIAAVVMLAMLPLGLAVMFFGMKKSPLLGLAALPLVWNHLTHWGFLNFVGAVGLFCMSIGLSLLVLDKPTFRRQCLLSTVLVALFFTHIFRFPLAILGVVGTAVVMYPATRRVWPIVPPLVVPLAFFAAWMRVRPVALQGGIDLSRPDTTRLREFFPYLLESGFQDVAGAQAITTASHWLGAIAVVLILLVVIDGRLARQTRRQWSWGAGVTVVALGCAFAFFLLFLMMPMQSGTWWYVYPREAIATMFVALGALPDLPRTTFLRIPIVLALAFAPLATVRSVSTNYREFDRVTDDFHRITRSIPLAPKLMYLVFDHGGTKMKNTPFIHLPAYVQAEKGGWLSFHFAVFGASPILYRDKSEPGAIIPPPVPTRWEWTPQRFRPLEHGRFFDWFLVRSATSPTGLFHADPMIRPVDHVGSWWLYRRTETPARPH